MTILFGGVPLLSPGDETGQPNDYSYRRDPGLADDSRWAGRPRMDWEAAARRHDPATIEGRLYAGFQRLIAIRRDEAAFDGVATEIIGVGNDHLFGFTRQGAAGGQALILANVTEGLQMIDGNTLRLHGHAYHFRDLLGGESYSATRPCTLAPYQLLCLVPE